MTCIETPHTYTHIHTHTHTQTDRRTHAHTPAHMHTPTKYLFGGKAHASAVEIASYHAPIRLMKPNFRRRSRH